MGGICSSGIRHSSPDRASGSGGTYGASARTSHGDELTHVRQLSTPEREKFLDAHDPLRSIPGLDDPNALVYRTMSRQYVNDGMASAHPDSGTVIELADQLGPNVRGRKAGIAEGTAYAYLPRLAKARDLGVPTLNVLYGERAQRAVQGYASSSDNVTVAMRVRDFLDQGGKIYKDSLAAANNDDNQALVITVPHGEVPARILD